MSNLRKESNASGGDSAEVVTLKKELEKKDKDLLAMKKQSEGLAREYSDLGDRFAAKEGTTGEPRKDQ